MMTARDVRPRVQLHRGTVVAAAFWFDPALLGVREARRRVLAAWVPGASVSMVAGGLLLRLLQPRAVACSQAPGLPLTLEDGVLTSAPLRAVERSRLAAPPGTAVLVRAGRAEVHPLDGSRGVDVSAWLDVSGWRAVEVVGLGAPPPPVPVLEPVALPGRARFGPGVPVLAAEAEAMLAKMEGRPVPVAPTAAAPTPPRRSLLWRLQRPVAGWMDGFTVLAVTFALLVCMLVLVAGSSSGGFTSTMPFLPPGMAPFGSSPLPDRLVAALFVAALVMSAVLAWLLQREERPWDEVDAPSPKVEKAGPPVEKTGLLFHLNGWLRERRVRRVLVTESPEAGGVAVRPASRSLRSRVAAWLRGETVLPVDATAQVRAGEASRRAGAGTASRMGRFIGWLFRGTDAGTGSTGARPVGASSRASGVAREVRPARPSFLSRFAAWFSSGSAAASARPRTPPPPPAGPGLLSRLSEWALRSTPLGRLVGQRKADYMRRLFDMFDEGNLQEALRYAIPLTGKVAEQARVSLGVPSPREQLSLNLQSGGGAASSIFGNPPAVVAALQAKYRAAFQRLEREGKIDEAAFVLTELLGAHEEAVSFLERHGKLKLAAELAEARELPPGLVVRQWFLAKDVARAVALARRSGAFSEAVARLERQNNRTEACALRLLWAETLAQMGDYALAVDVVWPVTEARGLARAWLERGAALGGVGGARTLARLVLAFPEQFEAVKGRVLELLADESRERAPERAAFAEAVGAESPSEPRTALAGPVVRALLRDKAAGRVRHLPSGLPLLLRDPGLGALRADLPTGAEREDSRGTSPWSAVLVEQLSAAEAGAFAVHDAVPLPGGRLLVALGEAGARLLRPDGTALAHFDAPAFRLVPSVHGDRALAVAPRGELLRVSRLDLSARRAEPWCDARVDAFASSYDGNLWFVSEGNTALAVDALARDWRALWRVTQVGQRVLAVAQEGAQLSLLAAEGPVIGEVWTYGLAGGPTLRSRRPVTDERRFAHAALLADGTLELGEGVLLGSGWRVQLTEVERGHEARLAQQVTAVRARIVFEGPHPPQGRFWGRELVLFDAAGRLARVDLAEGTVRRLRVL